MKPSKIEHVVWPDQSEGTALVQQVQAGQLRDNLLLYGPPGTGKTTLAHIVADQLAVDPMNLFEYNGGEHNSTADLDRIINTLENQWVICGGYERRLVIYDEVDCLGDVAIKRLKGILDRFTNSVRWIFTTNNLSHLERKDPAFVDRCRVICMDYAMTDQAQQRFVKHLESQGVPAAELVALNCRYNWRQVERQGVFDDQ
jgi:replication-associated recombination protein RarA